MKLLKITLAISLLVSILVVYGTHLVKMNTQDDYGCSTDTECINECLVNCYSQDECRLCFDDFLGIEQYELYEARLQYLDN